MVAVASVDYVKAAFQLLQHDQLAEAKTLLKRGLKDYPQHLDLMFLLAQAERRLKRFPDAIALLKKCCAMSPLAPYRAQLGLALMQTNEGCNQAYAAKYFREALALDSAQPDAAMNLMTIATRYGMPGTMVDAVLPTLVLPLDDVFRLRLTANLAIAFYLRGDHGSTRTFIQEVMARRGVAYDATGAISNREIHFLLIYTDYLVGLIRFHEMHTVLYEGADETTPLLHIIGESHSLAPAHLVLKREGAARKVVTHWQMGTKAYHMTVPKEEDRQFAVRTMVQAIPEKDPIVIMFGELDCRPDEGLISLCLRNPNEPIEPFVQSLIDKYVQFVQRLQRKRAGPIFLFGVPAPNRVLAPLLAEAERDLLTRIIRVFNNQLAQTARAAGLRFLDIYAIVAADDGWAREDVHIDDVHLTPATVYEALLPCV